MSFAETRQIMADLQEIMQLLGTAEIKTRNIEAKAPIYERNLYNMRQLERVALRYLAVVRQIGLPEDVEKAIQLITRLIVVIRMAQMSVNMMAGGPIGLASGAAGLLLTGLSMGSMLEGY